MASREQHTTGPEQAAKVEEDEVTLVAGKGSATRGGGPDGRYWHIYVHERRVGNIFINLIDEAPLGKHHSIQIHLNQPFRGKGIGRIAYSKACQASGFDKVYAHMKKSNLASKKAAEAAGFSILELPGAKQLTMAWNRAAKRG